MEIYKINPTKRTKCINRKANQSKKPIAIFLRVLKWLISIGMIIFTIYSISNIEYSIFVELILLIIELSFPFVVLAFAHLFLLKVTDNMYAQGNEYIIMTDKGFMYCYDLKYLPNIVVKYDIEYDKITDYKIDEKTRYLFIEVECEYNEYDKGVLCEEEKSPVGGVELFDTYKGISVYDLLKEKVKLDVKAKDINE